MNYDDVYDVEARKKVQTSLRFRVRKERERGGGGREGGRERERERERDVPFLLYFFLIEEIGMIIFRSLRSIIVRCFFSFS